MADAADFVMDMLSRVNKADLGKTHTVIVPDRASLEAERALLKTLKGSFNACVKTFRRLAADVLPKYDYLSKQAGIMALSGIIKDNKDKLTCFIKGVETPGFVENVYETISMMKYCRIKPEALLRDLPKGVSGKAQDIALLYKAYLDYTRDRFIDSADKMDLLCEELKQKDFASNGYFYLYDFDNFSAQELKIVEQLMLKSCGVTVACCASDKPNDRHLYLNDIFNGVLKLCRDNGVEPNVIEGKRYRNNYVKQIGDNLYRYGEKTPVEANGFVQVFEGGTRYDELYELACQIQRYVRGGGRFRDIYVVTSDITKYTNAISTIFDEFEIPYFCDRQYVLADHPYSRFVTDYLALCRTNGKLSSVLPFVKNRLFCGYLYENSDNDVYLFENYCLKYNVSYRYDGFRLGRDESCFEAANRFREQFNALFGTLKAPNSATVGEYVAFVRDLIEKAQLCERNDDFAEKQSLAGLDFESGVTSQVAEKFEGVLTQAERVLGERYVKLDEFLNILKTGLASVKISVIPLYSDSVIFANMAKARKHDIKFLALLGANQGAMPIVKSDTKLLTDRNITALVDAGIDVEPLILTENRRERFSLFQLLLEPTEKLYMSYTLSDGKDELKPSMFVGELCDLFAVNGKNLAPIAADADIYTERQAFDKLVSANRKLKDREAVHLPAFDALTELYKDKLAKYQVIRDGSVKVERGRDLYLKNSRTSVSQLTDFFKCPYRFYLQYGLNVKPRTVSELQAGDLGNILHAVLEKYVKKMDVKEEDDVTRQKARECFDSALDDDFYRGLVSDVKMTGILAQLKAESERMCVVVKTQLRDSDFVNYAVELTFGSGAMNPVQVEFDGGKFNLVGKIDRIDVCDDRFIIIDYKSGAKAACYTEKELYIGHKLQLPVYVRAVQDNTHKRPAGFYYFNMHDNFTKQSDPNDYFYNGRTLNDVGVACGIDRNLLNGRSKKLGLSLKSNGEFNMQSGRTRLLSDEQFDNQISYSFELIKRAGNLMKEGYADVNPYEGACSYCDYKDICDYDDAYKRQARNVEDDVDKNTIDRTVKKDENV